MFENKNEKEKYQEYLASREWGLLREQVKARSRGICERCKINPSDAVHHLTYIRKYHELLEDLQDTCDTCHEFIHGKTDCDPIIIRLRQIESLAMALARKLSETSDEFLSSIPSDHDSAAALCYVHAIVTDSLRNMGIFPAKRGHFERTPDEL